MRQSGFSLGEVALGISIAVAMSTVVAASASYTMHAAKLQELREIVKDFQQAIETYGTMGAQNPSVSFPPNPIWNVGIFRKDPASSSNYKNVYTQATTNLWNVVTGANQTYTPGYANTNYPLNSTSYKGTIIYFYRIPPITSPYFLAWDGAQSQKFTYYCLQAFDDMGYPVMTVGR